MTSASAAIAPEQMEGVDLSCWKIALNGAEPVHAETIERFIETFARHGFNSQRRVPGLWHGGSDFADLRRTRGAGHVTRTVSRSALQAHRVDAPVDRADAQRSSAAGTRLSMSGSPSSIRTGARACRPTRSAKSG